MQSKAEIQQGWDFATGIMGANVASNMGQEYVRAVETAIIAIFNNTAKRFNF